MPEHLFPGVFVEELGTRPTPIEGVPTGTCAFVGTTRKGPVGVPSKCLTSFADFTRRFGGLDDLRFFVNAKAERRRNYLAHAVQAFFLVHRQRGRAEQRGEFAGGRASRQIHLEKPLLRMHITERAHRV